MSTANEKQIAEKIRSQYTERKISKLDELKELDQRVKCPAKVFAVPWCWEPVCALP